MNNEQQPIWFNTWVIVIAFIVCWPVGIVLLIGRVNSSKQTMFDGGKTTRVCLIVGAILILIGFSSFSGKKFFAGLFYIAGGAALIYFANKNKKKVERYKGYIDLVANQKIYSLDTISNTMNVTYDVAREEIQKLIDKGSFRGATINELTRSIEIVQAQPRNYIPDTMPNLAQPVMNSYAESTGSGMPKMVTAVCPGCGGTTAAQKGTTVECDYCGKVFTA